MKTLKEYQGHIKKMKEDPEYKKKYLIEMEEKRKEDFRKRKPFVTADDVPELPQVDIEEWKEFYVPLIIEKGGIPKEKLLDGEWYYGDHRRCNFARWNEKENKFDYIRYKFGFYWDDCNHFEDDDGYALFVPIRKATEEEEKNELEKIKK